MNNLKTLLKKHFPCFVRYLRSIIDHFRLIQNYIKDLNRFKKFAFDFRKDNDEINLAAKITLYYHALEKGLSNQKIREGFGQSAIENLMAVLTEYHQKGFSLGNKRFLSGLRVLQEYCDAHNNEPEHTALIKNFLDQFPIVVPNIKGGVINYSRNDVIPLVNLNFLTLSSARVSVRDYSDESVDESLIFNSIAIAMKSPSVCNRQAWKVHLIKHPDLLGKTLSVQGGLKGHGANIKNLLLITVDLRYFSKEHERNQGFVDGGIFLMSLVYALTYNGLATCILNADFNHERESLIRKLLRIESSEILIGFVSLGHYPDTFKVPVSLRDSYKDCLVIH